jgi:prepilin-type N-terminal cleavage/methylation domain-containing protein
VTSRRDDGRRAMRGMTLIELLVALAIFAVVGGTLYPVVTGALTSRADATDRVRVGAEARVILDRLEQDLVGNVDAGHPSPLPPRFVAPPSIGRRNAGERILLETVAVVARGVVATDGIALGQLTESLPADRGDLAQVRWRIDPNGRRLRQEVRPPRRDPVDWTTVPVEVLSDRAEVELEFWEPETWLEAWDSREPGPRNRRAPLAVRSTVRVGGPEGLELVSSVLLPTVESGSARRRAAEGARP